MAGADFAGAKPQVRTAVELVEVEQQLLARVISRDSAEQGILTPSLVPGVIAPAAEALRDRRVGFVDPTHQLMVESVLQWLGMAHDAPCVVVLGLEVLKNGRVVEVAKPVE